MNPHIPTILYLLLQRWNILKPIFDLVFGIENRRILEQSLFQMHHCKSQTPTLIK